MGLTTEVRTLESALIATTAINAMAVIDHHEHDHHKLYNYKFGTTASSVTQGSTYVGSRSSLATSSLRMFGAQRVGGLNPVTSQQAISNRRPTTAHWCMWRWPWLHTIADRAALLAYPQPKVPNTNTESQLQDLPDRATAPG